jgi:hypothetical protein
MLRKIYYLQIIDIALVIKQRYTQTPENIDKVYVLSSFGYFNSFQNTDIAYVRQPDWLLYKLSYSTEHITAKLKLHIFPGKLHASPIQMEKSMLSCLL